MFGISFRDVVGTHLSSLIGINFECVIGINLSVRLEVIFLYIQQCNASTFSLHFPSSQSAVQFFIFTFCLFHLSNHERQKFHKQDYRKSDTKHQ